MSEGERTLIKVCGVVTPEDAILAGRAGADLVGMILWAGSRRGVNPETARRIAEAARESGAEPVGVFVDGSAREIAETAKGAGIRAVQLHGSGARRSFPDLPEELARIWVVDVRAEGRPAESPPDGLDPSRDHLLFDSPGGGTGRSFDREAFSPPKGFPWFLAGGLTPETVGLAVRTLRPGGVDVSTGVAGPDGVRKDPIRIQRFVAAVRGEEG